MINMFSSLAERGIGDVAALRLLENRSVIVGDWVHAGAAAPAIELG